MIVKVLVENTEYETFKGEHGLSLLIEYKGNKYLVDTGSSNMFAENAKIMKENLAEVDMAFLSHAHYDHSTGFSEFFEENKTAKVFLQKHSKQKYYYKIVGPIKKYIGIPKGMLEKYDDRFVYVDGYMNVGNGIYILPHTTKNLSERGKEAGMCTISDNSVIYDDFSHEQTVVFEEEDGLVCFNSCSHAGVENIIEEVKLAFPDKRIKAFFGGFHMMGALGVTTCAFKKEEVWSVAEKLLNSSDAIFYSGHCTGIIAYQWLAEKLGDRIQSFHSGKIIEV